MSIGTGVQGITEGDIADYLANTPGFFERQAELLAAIQLTSPHGQRAVSLQERQMEMLRDKIRGLEHKIIEMIRHGQDNVVIADRLHRWTCALMLTPEPAELPAVLVRELSHQFMIPQGGMRLWGVSEAHAGAPFATPVSDDAKSFAASLSLPYCGVNAGFEAVQWLPEPGAAMSMALVPLRRPGAVAAFGAAGANAAVGAAGAALLADTFGLLVLASPDPTRYAADMGTDFLVRIGEIAGAALARLLPPAG